MSDDDEPLMERIDRFPEQGAAVTCILTQMMPMVYENCTQPLTRSANYLEAFYEYRDDLLARVARGGKLESKEKAWLILYRELSRIRSTIPPMTEAESRRAAARRRDDRIAELKDIEERKAAAQAEEEGRARYQAKQTKQARQAKRAKQTKDRAEKAAATGPRRQSRSAEAQLKTEFPRHGATQV